MLRPSVIGEALVSTLQRIPDLLAMLNDDPANISLHLYSYGNDFRLTEALYKMVPPSLLIAWDGTQGGNFTGQTEWKHSFRGFGRISNQAGAGTPIGLDDLWMSIVNGKIESTTQNIRQIQVYPGVDLMDTPSSLVRQDQELMDYLEFRFVFPEIGDN